MIMENMYCQSCGMPLTKEEEVATNKAKPLCVFKSLHLFYKHVSNGL